MSVGFIFGAMPLQDDYVRTSIRVPPDLYEQVRAAATQAGRSINEELVARVAQSALAAHLDTRLDVIEGLIRQLQPKGK